MKLNPLLRPNLSDPLIFLYNRLFQFCKAGRKLSVMLKKIQNSKYFQAFKITHYSWTHSFNKLRRSIKLVSATKLGQLTLVNVLIKPRHLPG